MKLKISSGKLPTEAHGARLKSRFDSDQFLFTCTVASGSCEAHFINKHLSPRLHMWQIFCLWLHKVLFALPCQHVKLCWRNCHCVLTDRPELKDIWSSKRSLVKWEISEDVTEDLPVAWMEERKDWTVSYEIHKNASNSYNEKMKFPRTLLHLWSDKSLGKQCSGSVPHNWVNDLLHQISCWDHVFEQI